MCLIALDIIQGFGGQYKKASVDAAAILWLFRKGNNPASFCNECAEPARRTDRGYRRQRFLLPVKRQKSIQINVRQTVTVSEKKVFVIEICANTLQASSGHGICARIDKRYLPWFGRVLMNVYLVASNIESDVADVKGVVRKITLDDVSQIPAADDKILYPVSRVDLHQMP